MLKEKEDATRLSVRTRPGGVDATVLCAIWGGGGHARAAGASLALPLADAVAVVIPEAIRSPGRWPGERASRRRDRAGDAARPPPRARIDAGLDGILVVDKPVGPTSHDVVALVRRLAGTKRIGHGGTLDPFASGVLPLYLGPRTRVVEFHLGARKAYRATVCFGAVVDHRRPGGRADADRCAGPVARGGGGRAGGLPRDAPPAAAGRSRRARSAGGEPTPWPGPATRPSCRLARPPSTPCALERWDETDPEQPLAVIDVACSAGTYVRALARDLGAAVGERAPTSARSAAPRRGRSRSTTRSASTSRARRPPTGVSRTCSGRWAPASTTCRPSPSGPEELAVSPTAAGSGRAAGSRRRSGRRSGVASAPRTQPIADRVRLLFEDGSLAAIARRVGGRLVPGQGARAPSRRRAAWLIRARPAPAGPAPRRRGAVGAARRSPPSRPGTDRCSWSWASSTGSTAGTPTCCASSGGPPAGCGAVPTVLTFDHHPDEIVAGAAPPLLCDPEERLVRLARAGVAVTIVQHFDEALRRTPYDAFVESIRTRTGLAGFLMTPDAAFGHERRGTPAALAALGVRDGFEVVVVPPFDLDGRAGPQHRDPRRDRGRRSRDCPRAPGSARRGRPGRSLERSADGRRTTLAFRVPVALPPPGRYAATVEPAIAPGMAARPSAGGPSSTSAGTGRSA